MSDPVQESAFLKKYEGAPVIVANCNAMEMKYTLDDAFRLMMVSDFGFVENHWHSDVKLLLGYSACAFALFATVYSYFIPFPACKSVLLIGVIGYFTLNSAMLLYTSMIEHQIVFVGEKKDPLGLEPHRFIKISSEGNKFSADYKITVDVTLVEKSNKKRTESSGKKSSHQKTFHFGQFFDESGCFSAEQFQKLMHGLLAQDKLKLQ